MRRLFPIALLACLVGCSGNDTPVARAAGSWPGRFAIESVGGATDPATIQAEEMKGDLELYATGMKFLLDMSTPHQRYTIKGKWRADKNRITLTTDSYTFDNPREEDQKAFKLKIVTPDQIRAVFGHALVLEESRDKRNLTGLKTSLGRLIGRFEFERPIPH